MAMLGGISMMYEHTRRGFGSRRKDHDSGARSRDADIKNDLLLDDAC